MVEDIRQLMTKVTLVVPLARRLVSLTEKSAYKARRGGDIPSLKVSGKYRVATAKLRGNAELAHHRVVGRLIVRNDRSRATMTVAG